jgi:hypothetical protein
MSAATPHVSYETYAKLGGVNISTLKELGRSPLHYRHRLANPKESKPLTLGSAAHCAVLEPERFDRDHAVWGERTESGRLRPRIGKAYEAFEVLNAHRKILTEPEQVDALAMQAAVRSSAPAMRYLRAGEPEVTMQWVDEETCAPCRGRADWITTDAGWPVIVGLKTARDCRPILFGNQAAKLGYHLQWAFYRDGFEKIHGKAPRMVEIVVESVAPHDVAVYIIPAEIIEQGRAEYRDLLVRLADCKRANNWPGAVPGETHLTLPSWVYDSDDDVSGLELEGFGNE